MTIYTPYTYRIGWTKLDKHYYGVRFAKNCNPSDLWESYFTSSKYVKEFRKIHGEPDIIEIRKIFESSNAARVWENKVLKKIKAAQSDKWLNKTNGATDFYFSSYMKEDYEPWNKGKTGIYSEETLEKISQRMKGNIPWNKGKTMDESFCRAVTEGMLRVSEKLSEANKNKTHYKDPEYRKRQSDAQLKIAHKISERQTGSGNSFYNKRHTDETKKIQSEKNIGCYWWTDGHIEIKSKICPSGFYRGRKPKLETIKS